jgi:hypothetical protein
MTNSPLSLAIVMRGRPSLEWTGAESGVRAPPSGTADVPVYAPPASLPAGATHGADDSHNTPRPPNPAFASAGPSAPVHYCGSHRSSAAPGSRATHGSHWPEG